MDLKDFWYIAAETKELKRLPLAVKILDEWIVLFRNEAGQAIALQDRCVHRCAQLSKGKVVGNFLRCPYHGWTYDEAGAVVRVPSEGTGDNKVSGRRAIRYAVTEIDDYIYVRLNQAAPESIRPFRIPHYGRRGWKSIRLKNRFANNVTNCVENFVDIPHTVSVHPGIFRKEKGEKIEAKVERKSGSVFVTYRNEKANLGFFSKLLNPRDREIRHTDHFHMPNVTSVHYDISERRQFFISSQSIPVTAEETLVYTDLTYDYGIFNPISAPIVRQQAQTIIDQDIEILGNQMKTIRKYGNRFMNSEADVIHVLIESIRSELEKGGDPLALPEKTHQIEFWV